MYRCRKNVAGAGSAPAAPDGTQTSCADKYMDFMLDLINYDYIDSVESLYETMSDATHNFGAAANLDTFYMTYYKKLAMTVASIEQTD